MEGLSEGSLSYEVVHHPVDFVCMQQLLPSRMQAELHRSLSTLMWAGGLVRIQQLHGVVSLSVPADSTASEAQHFGEVFTHFSLFGLLFSGGSSFTQA